MKKYVKKPIVIEAIVWTGENKKEVLDFCGEQAEFIVLREIDEYLLQIKTLEGVMDCKVGSYIIKGVKGEFYPCDEEIFELTYSPVEVESAKSLHNTSSNGAKKNVKDIQFWGDGDTFALISKASSENEGWMKSTKAMEIEGVGCVVQVTTQQRNPDGSYSLDEAVTFVPNTKIETTIIDGYVVSRKVVLINKPIPFK